MNADHGLRACCETTSDLLSIVTMNRAPDIKGTYPSAGQYIGPLWQRMWDHLSDGQWATVWSLADATAADPEQDYVAARGTVNTLLSEATKAGLVEKKPGLRQKRYVLYRRLIGVAPVVKPGRYAPAPARSPKQSAAVETRMLDVLDVLLDRQRQGLTMIEWMDLCLQEAELPTSTARRYIRRLIAGKHVVDDNGKPVTEKNYVRGMKLFPAPLDTPDQGV